MEPQTSEAEKLKYSKPSLTAVAPAPNSAQFSGNRPFLFAYLRKRPRPWAQETQAAGLYLLCVSPFRPELSSSENWAFVKQSLSPNTACSRPPTASCFPWRLFQNWRNAFIVNLDPAHLDSVQSKNLDKYYKPEKVCTRLRPVAINYFK